MENIEKVDYWLELAEYDLETAKAMLLSGRYLYVGFMCQQCIEKALKGLFVKSTSEIPPKIHSLNILAQKIGIDKEIPDNLSDVFDELEPLNIEARYPTYKDEIFKLLNNEYCNVIIDKTTELLKWIKAKL